MKLLSIWRPQPKQNGSKICLWSSVCSCRADEAQDIQLVWQARQSLPYLWMVALFCSSLKRMTCLDGTDWDKPASEDAALMCHELAEKLQECDPVTGLCHANTSSAVAWCLWCDASDLAYGVALESDGSIIEDGCWLRPPEDKRHINLAELEAVIKGLSLAAKWNVYQRATHDRFEDGCRVAEADHGQRTSRENQVPA